MALYFGVCKHLHHYWRLKPYGDVEISLDHLQFLKVKAQKHLSEYFFECYVRGSFSDTLLYYYWHFFCPLDDSSQKFSPLW